MSDAGGITDDVPVLCGHQLKVEALALYWAWRDKRRVIFDLSDGHARVLFRRAVRRLYGSDSYYRDAAHGFANLDLAGRPCAVWSEAHAVGLVRPFRLGCDDGPQPVMLCWRRRAGGRDFVLPIVLASRLHARELARQMRDEHNIPVERAQIFEAERASQPADKFFAMTSEGTIEPRNRLESAMQEVLDRDCRPSPPSPGPDPLVPLIPDVTASEAN